MVASAVYFGLFGTISADTTLGDQSGCSGGNFCTLELESNPEHESFAWNLPLGEGVDYTISGMEGDSKEESRWIALEFSDCDPTYSMSVTALDADGNDHGTKEVDFNPTGCDGGRNGEVQAQPAAEKLSCDQVRFYDQNPIDAEDTYEWDIGADGSVEGNGQEYTHTFSNTGDYDIELTVNPSEDETDSETDFVQVAPDAEFSYSKVDANGTEVEFNGSESCAPGGIGAYVWDFDCTSCTEIPGGGGFEADGSGGIITNQYNSDGSKNPTLRVVGNDGESRQLQKSISIPLSGGGSVDDASFSYSVDGENNIEVTALSPVGEEYSYRWYIASDVVTNSPDFVGQNQSFSAGDYSSPGPSIDVTLGVTESGTNLAETTKSIPTLQGQSEEDSDGDGEPDSTDECPNDAENNCNDGGGGGDDGGGGGGGDDGGGSGSTTGLVNCGNPGADGVLQESEMCDYAALISMIGDIIRWLIGILVMVATLLFMYAGILYLTAGSDSGQVDTAKEIFQNVAGGFLIVLLAFALIATLVNMLTREDWRDNWDQAIPIELSINRDAHNYLS